MVDEENGTEEVEPEIADEVVELSVGEVMNKLSSLVDNWKKAKELVIQIEKEVAHSRSILGKSGIHITLDEFDTPGLVAGAQRVSSVTPPIYERPSQEEREAAAQDLAAEDEEDIDIDAVEPVNIDNRSAVVIRKEALQQDSGVRRTDETNFKSAIEASFGKALGILDKSRVDPSTPIQIHTRGL